MNVCKLLVKEKREREHIQYMYETGGRRNCVYTWKLMEVTYKPKKDYTQTKTLRQDKIRNNAKITK